MNSKIFFKILSSLVFLFLSPLVVQAADLEITCYEDQKPVIQRNTDPLFNLSSFLPDSTEKREIYVNNTDDTNPCRIYMYGKGSESNLGDKIITEISEGTYYNTLSNFIKSERILIADLLPNTDTTKTMSLHFEKDTDNSLMNQKLSFDIVIESEWGASSSDTADIEGVQDARGGGDIFDVILQALGIEEEETTTEEEEAEDLEEQEDVSILGEEDTEKTCTEKTLWWLPLLIQLLLTTILIYVDFGFLKNPYVKLIVSVIFSVISFLVINKIGCGCNPAWLCTNHWIVNILIAILPVFKTPSREEFSSKL